MPLVRKPAAASTPSSPAVTGIVEGLSSSSEETRWAAARAAVGIAACTQALAAALRVEPAARVREAMLTSLARSGDADSMAAVLPLLRSDDAGLRTGALDALRLMIGKAPELLPPLLADADVDVRILSCELARALPGDVATSMLCDLLRHEEDVNACAAALDVLAEVGQASALPVLADCALKFRDTAFLAFAIEVTAARISAQSPGARG